MSAGRRKQLPFVGSLLLASLLDSSHLQTVPALCFAFLGRYVSASLSSLEQSCHQSAAILSQLWEVFCLEQERRQDFIRVGTNLSKSENTMRLESIELLKQALTLGKGTTETESE